MMLPERANASTSLLVSRRRIEFPLMRIFMVFLLSPVLGGEAG
jgi:hypothetical protein